MKKITKKSLLTLSLTGALSTATLAMEEHTKNFTKEISQIHPNQELLSFLDDTTKKEIIFDKALQVHPTLELDQTSHRDLLIALLVCQEEDTVIALLNEKPEFFEALTIPHKNSSYPIHFAAEKGLVKVIKYLHEQKVDLTIKTGDNTTICHYATLKGHLDLSIYLFENCRDLMFEGDEHKQDAFLYAIRGKNHDFIKYLCLNHQLFLTEIRENSYPLLNSLSYIAAITGELDSFRALFETFSEFEQGEESNAEEKFNITAEYKEFIIYTGSAQGQLNILAYLCEYYQKRIEQEKSPVYFPICQAITSIKETVDRLPKLHYLTENFRHFYHFKDHDGRTPLHWAASSRNFEAIKYLCENHHELISEKDNQEKTAANLVAEDLNTNHKLEFLKYICENAKELISIPTTYRITQIRQNGPNIEHERPNYFPLHGLLNRAPTQELNLLHQVVIHMALCAPHTIREAILDAANQDLPNIKKVLIDLHYLIKSDLLPFQEGDLPNVEKITKDNLLSVNIHVLSTCLQHLPINHNFVNEIIKLIHTYLAALANSNNEDKIKLEQISTIYRNFLIQDFKTLYIHTLKKKLLTDAEFDIGHLLPGGNDGSTLTIGNELQNWDWSSLHPATALYSQSVEEFLRKIQKERKGSQG